MSDTKQHPIMPIFLFERRRDIEIELDIPLAGDLSFDFPAQAAHELTDDEQQVLQQAFQAIVEPLAEIAKSGKMDPDAVIFGWTDDYRPPDADEIENNKALMRAWARDRVLVAVRVDDRPGSTPRLDSDIARQLGLVREH